MGMLWKKCSVLFATDFSDELAGTRGAKVKCLSMVLNHILSTPNVSSHTKIHIREEQMFDVQHVMEMGFPASYFEKNKLHELTGMNF
jgi:hypothetical protein